MIRINLLPVKKAKRREAGQRQILYMGMAVMAAIGGVVFAHMHFSGERDELARVNRVLTSDIDRLKGEIGDYDKIKVEREGLMKQRKSIDSLKAGRTGPVFLLRELSEILTPGKGPTFDRIAYEERLRRDPNVGFRANWDPKKVAIESFEEEGKKVRIRGTITDVSDYGEFLNRLQLSVFFQDVNTESLNSVTVTNSGSLKQFILTATVIY